LSDEWIAENIRLSGFPTQLYDCWGGTDRPTAKMTCWYFFDNPSGFKVPGDKVRIYPE